MLACIDATNHVVAGSTRPQHISVEPSCPWTLVHRFCSRYARMTAEDQSVQKKRLGSYLLGIVAQVCVCVCVCVCMCESVFACVCVCVCI
jgi:hypothetical protein